MAVVVGEVTISPTVLLLADGRFPAGGHAHSGGVEAMVASGGVSDVASLGRFLRGRLTSSGAVNAAFGAASCRAATGNDLPRLHHLDEELDARMPSPVLRAASRSLGRQLMRSARRVWPDAHLAIEAPQPGAGLHQPVALGLVAAAAGLCPLDAATVASYESVSAPATAAVRLLGLDPFAVHRALAGLAPLVQRVAAEGAAHADTRPCDLPAWSTPLLDIATDRHANAEVRLFAS
jgi:urease accessory protein